MQCRPQLGRQNTSGFNAVGSQHFLARNMIVGVSISYTITILFIVKSSTVLFKNWKE